MPATKTLRARSRVSATERVDVALLHFFITYRTWRCGLPVDWEHTARRMAEALGWDGGLEDELPAPRDFTREPEDDDSDPETTRRMGDD